MTKIWFAAFVSFRVASQVEISHDYVFYSLAAVAAPPPPLSLARLPAL